MDPKFADRMLELSEVSEETLTQRWETLVAVASQADSPQRVRLVLLACREELNRNADEWFWKPFRENEIAFPVENGVELHARLAEAAVRKIIEEGDTLTAMFVRLALNTGRVPFSQDLVDAAVARLREEEVEVPAFVAPSAIWTSAVSKQLNEAPDHAAVGAAVETIASSAQGAVTALSNQLTQLVSWARAAEERFGVERRLVQWLLGGSREDGSPWHELPIGVRALDSAVEMADFVIGAPQPRHEAILGQVLALAGSADDSAKLSSKDAIASFEVPDPTLAPLVPISTLLAKGEALPKLTPLDLATRVLWEVCVVNAWTDA